MKNNYELATIYKYHESFTPSLTVICKNGIMLAGPNKGKRISDLYNRVTPGYSLVVPFNSKKKGLYVSSKLEKEPFRKKSIDISDQMVEFKIVDQNIYTLDYTIEKHECYEEKDKKDISNRLMNNVYASCERKTNKETLGYQEVEHEINTVASSIKRNGTTPDNSLTLKMLQSKLETKE